MRNTSSLTASRLFLLSMFFLFAGLATSATLTQRDGRKPHFSGGSDGVGVLPFAGPKGQFQPLITTLGLVVDAQRDGISGALVVVTHPVLGLVATAQTDAQGAFTMILPAVENLELALPHLAVSGIEVGAGIPIVIIVP